MPFTPLYTRQAWGLLYTKLMLAGQVVGGDGVKGVRITEEGIEVVGEYNIVTRVKYKSLWVFDDTNIVGLPPVEKENNHYEVIDKLQAISLVSSPTRHTLTTEDVLLKTLHVWKKTQRSPIEIYGISQLSGDQLQDFNYSDTMVKFKAEHLLTEKNFVGKSRGNNQRLPIELQVCERKIFKKMDYYSDTPQIKLFYGRI